MWVELSVVSMLPAVLPKGVTFPSLWLLIANVCFKHLWSRDDKTVTYAADMAILVGGIFTSSLA